MTQAAALAIRSLVEDIGAVRAFLVDGAADRLPPADIAHGLDLVTLDPGERATLADAIDDIQVASKLWLLDQLAAVEPLAGSTVLVLGGWCGVLPWLHHVTGGLAPALALCVDSDARACSIGRRAVAPATPSLRFVCQDVYRLDYARLAEGGRLVVINTICEHLPDLPRWRAMLPPGILTVLQSNNYRGCPDHVSCVDSAGELGEAAQLQRLDYEGALPLSLFTRYMVIGRS